MMPDSAFMTTVRPPVGADQCAQARFELGQKSDDERVDTLVPVISLT